MWIAASNAGESVRGVPSRLTHWDGRSWTTSAIEAVYPQDLAATANEVWVFGTHDGYMAGYRFDCKEGANA